MLRFSYFRSDSKEDWRLWGRLAGPWVDELRSVWRRIREHAPRTHAVVHLKEVTFIDQAGQQLLAEMRNAGADLVATGVEYEHLLPVVSDDGPGLVRRKAESPAGGRR